MATQRC